MSDEESFVILGESPTASMETVNSSAPESWTDKPTESQQKTSTNNDLECQLTNSAASSNESQYTVVNKSSEPANPSETTAAASGNGVAIEKDTPSPGPVVEKTKPNTMQNSGSSSGSSVGGNLAASFILGEVDSNAIKSSLQSQFPNVLSSTPPISQNEMSKDLIEECRDLKATVLKNSNTFMHMSEIMTKLRKEYQETDEKRKAEIAKLSNENLNLRKDIEVKMEQIRINEKLRVAEQNELIRSVSEKQSKIDNMCAQIQKLEQHQLKSYEFIPRDELEASYQADASSTEYVTRLEYKTLQRRMAEMHAENLELKIMQRQQIDEIARLKEKLNAAEELQKKLQSDLIALEENKSGSTTNYESELKALREEVDILRKQLELYCQDFKFEQEAKENLVNEKDQLIADLRELQKKNQELIKEAQRGYEEHARQTMAPTGAFPKRRTLPDPTKLRQSSNPIGAPATTYSCPLCGRIFKTLSVLQEHVDQCLDGN